MTSPLTTTHKSSLVLWAATSSSVYSLSGMCNPLFGFFTWLGSVLCRRRTKRFHCGRQLSRLVPGVVNKRSCCWHLTSQRWRTSGVVGIDMQTDLIESLFCITTHGARHKVLKEVLACRVLQPLDHTPHSPVTNCHQDDWNRGHPQPARRTQTVLQTVFSSCPR